MVHKGLTAVLAAAALVGSTWVAVAEPAEEISWPPAGVTPVRETARELAARTETFSAREVELVRHVVPDATYVFTGSWGHEVEGLVDGQQYVNNNVRFTAPGGSAGFFLQLHAPGDFTATPARVCETTTCTRSVRTRDGGLLLFTESAGEWGGREVYGYRPNGEVVRVSAGYAELITYRELASLADDRAFTFTSRGAARAERRSR